MTTIAATTTTITAEQVLAVALPLLACITVMLLSILLPKAIRHYQNPEHRQAFVRGWHNFWSRLEPKRGRKFGHKRDGKLERKFKSLFGYAKLEHPYALFLKMLVIHRQEDRSLFPRLHRFRVQVWNKVVARMRAQPILKLGGPLNAHMRNLDNLMTMHDNAHEQGSGRRSKSAVLPLASGYLGVERRRLVCEECFRAQGVFGKGSEKTEPKLIDVEIFATALKNVEQVNPR